MERFGVAEEWAKDCDGLIVKDIEKDCVRGYIRPRGCILPYTIRAEWCEECEKEPLYNGKIIFTKGDDVFKTGHIYEIKDGKIKRPDCGELIPYGRRFHSIEDVKNYFTCKKERKYALGEETLTFVEVIE